ncbi:MAG: PQQ-binding-like beta-propeller repeat protein [Actinomycetota bacterium]
MRRAVIFCTMGLALAACTSGGTDPAPSEQPPTQTSAGSTPSPTTGPITPPVPDWPTYHGDAARTGMSRVLPTPTGALHTTAVNLDAAMYASPIVGAGVTIAATENNSVYGLDASGRPLWRAQLGPPARRSDLPCGNIDPSGITATPAYDPASGSVFVVTEQRDPVRHELVALDVRTGATRWHVSVDLPGADPRAMQERGALAVAGGRVWVPFGGRDGDCGDYKGRLVGVRLDGTGAAVDYTVPTIREGGIWAPAGPVVDPAGQLYVAVGNGEAGTGDRYDFSDSVLKIDPSTVKLLDSFSPRSWQSDNGADLDLGSQGPALVDERWVFIAGKSGTGYVLRQNALGGIGGEVSSLELCRSFGGPAVAGDVVYVPCADGVRAVRIDASGTMRVLWHAEQSIAGSPVLGGSRVWSLDQDAGRLHALDPVTGRSTLDVAVGDVTRFATPALHGNQVLVPTRAGLVVVTVS